MGGQLKPWPADARTLDEVLIGDGYCYRGFVKAEPRKHGPFQYAFRPMLPKEVTVTQREVGRLSDADKEGEAEDLVAKTVAAHLTWNSVTGGALTKEQVAGLPNRIYNKVYMQLIGVEEMGEGYDQDPQAPGKTSTQQLADDVKNSGRQSPSS